MAQKYNGTTNDGIIEKTVPEKYPLHTTRVKEELEDVDGIASYRNGKVISYDVNNQKYVIQFDDDNTTTTATATRTTQNNNNNNTSTTVWWSSEELEWGIHLYTIIDTKVAKSYSVSGNIKFSKIYHGKVIRILKRDDDDEILYTILYDNGDMEDYNDDDFILGLCLHETKTSTTKAKTTNKRKREVGRSSSIKSRKQKLQKNQNTVLKAMKKEKKVEEVEGEGMHDKEELEDDEDDGIDNIGAVLDVLSEQWENNYRLLVKFQQREEHCNVQQSHKEDGTNLGSWLDKQRQRKKKGELDSTLERRLEDIGVVWNVFSEQWEDNYRLLVKFRHREGHCNVPRSHKEDGMHLGRWIYAQRYRKRIGKLDITLGKRLEDIGVVWDVLSEKWENNYRLLVKFQQREGHCNVPRSHNEDGMNIGAWLHAQRRQKKNGELDVSLEKRLEDIGVVWNVLSEQWENNYRLLVKFRQRERHCYVPRNHKEDGMNLGTWLSEQRQQKRKGKLDVSLGKRLDDIGVVWDLLLEKWENNYRLLVKFQQREGHCNAPESHKEDGMNIGAWLKRQRALKKKGKLDGTLRVWLDDIGVVWNVFSEQWEDNYRILVKFRQREGHCAVPRNHKEDGMNLDTWLSEQRHQKKKGKLDGSIKKRLDDIGVVWSFLS